MIDEENIKVITTLRDYNQFQKWKRKHNNKKYIFVEDLGQGRRMGILSLKSGSKGKILLLDTELWKLSSFSILLFMKSNLDWHSGFVPADNICLGTIQRNSYSEKSFLLCFNLLVNDDNPLVENCSDIVIMNKKSSYWFWDIYNKTLPYRKDINWRKFFKYIINNDLGNEHVFSVDRELNSYIEKISKPLDYDFKINFLDTSLGVSNTNTPAHLINLLIYLKNSVHTPLRDITSFPTGKSNGIYESKILGDVEIHPTALIIKSQITSTCGKLKIGKNCIIFSSNLTVNNNADIPENTIFQNTNINGSMIGTGKSDLFYSANIKECFFFENSVHTSIDFYCGHSFELIQSIEGINNEQNILVIDIGNKSQSFFLTLDELNRKNCPTCQ